MTAGLSETCHAVAVGSDDFAILLIDDPWLAWRLSYSQRMVNLETRWLI